MAVKIRMKRMGRKHRSFFRICATDTRAPRDGRVIEELGTYDPSIPDTDARTIMNDERVNYWLKVGAQPSEKVAILIKKYGPGGTHLDQAKAARDRLALPKAVPDPGEPAYIPTTKGEEPAHSTAPGPEGATQLPGVEAGGAPAAE